MMTGLQTRIAIAIACLLLAAAGLLGWFAFIGHVEQRGYDRAVAERRAADNAYLAAETRRVRRSEQALQDQLYALSQTRNQERTRHETAIDNLRRAAAAGTERLHCPATRIHANPAPADTAAASGTGAEARPGDILPSTAGDIFSIAGGIAEGVRRESALIDAYNAARATCNAPAE